MYAYLTLTNNLFTHLLMVLVTLSSVPHLFNLRTWCKALGRQYNCVLPLSMDWELWETLLISTKNSLYHPPSYHCLLAHLVYAYWCQPNETNISTCPDLGSPGQRCGSTNMLQLPPLQNKKMLCLVCSTGGKWTEISLMLLTREQHTR